MPGELKGLLLLSAVVALVGLVIFGDWFGFAVLVVQAAAVAVAIGRQAWKASHRPPSRWG